MDNSMEAGASEGGYTVSSQRNHLEKHIKRLLQIKLIDSSTLLCKEWIFLRS